jgi:molybdopterin-guanine dinucleotide biosynthesis protein A
MSEGNDLPVYVLIGGASRRFGRDKASLPIDGVAWALCVGNGLAGASSDVTLVGSPADEAAWGAVRTLADAPGAEGPLAGVIAAINNRAERLGDGWLVVASCDLVAPTAAWLAPLLAAREEGLDAVAYHAAERWQPFPMLAHTRWTAGLGSLAARGDRSLQWVLDASRVAAVRWRGDPAGPPQANTPQELADRRASIARQGEQQ